MGNETPGSLSEHCFEFANFCFTDPSGLLRRITLDVTAFDKLKIGHDQVIDSSLFNSYGVHSSVPLLLRADLSTMRVDPFCIQPTGNILCDIFCSDTELSRSFASRDIASRAASHLISTGIVNAGLFRSEIEFFVFPNERCQAHSHSCEYYRSPLIETSIGSHQQSHHVNENDAYSATTINDLGHNMRSEMLDMMRKMGIQAHSHRYLGYNQHAISTNYNTLIEISDQIQLYKYCINQVAQSYGQMALFMPYPTTNTNKRSAMRIHQQIWNTDDNMDHSDLYQCYIGGILKHIRAISAFSNSSTNSYLSLESGTFFSYHNTVISDRSVYVTHVSSPKTANITINFPDPLSNPYLVLSAILMAGLDGIQNKIYPKKHKSTKANGHAFQEVYESPTCSDLETAITGLREDSEFLTNTNVFDSHFIDNYTRLKMEEIRKTR